MTLVRANDMMTMSIASTEEGNPMLTASEYIAALTELIDEHGDLDCVDSQDEPMAYPEFSDDTGKPAFVLAEKR